MSYVGLTRQLVQGTLGTSGNQYRRPSLTGGEKMRKKFEEASGKMKEALMKLELLLKKMEVEANDGN